MCSTWGQSPPPPTPSAGPAHFTTPRIIEDIAPRCHVIINLKPFARVLSKTPRISKPPLKPPQAFLERGSSLLRPPSGGLEARQALLKKM